MEFSRVSLLIVETVAPRLINVFHRKTPVSEFRLSKVAEWSPATLLNRDLGKDLS